MGEQNRVGVNRSRGASLQIRQNSNNSILLGFSCLSYSEGKRCIFKKRLMEMYLMETAEI